MLYVDRTENGIVVCEDTNGRRTELSAADIAGEVRDGDVLVKRNGKYKKSQRLTEKRRAEIIALQDRLIKRS